MSRKNDISTTEGYFEDLQQRLLAIPLRMDEPQTSFRGMRRLAPYFAYAASLLVAVLLGNAVLRRTAVPEEDDGWTYVSYLADALDPDGAVLVDGTAWEEEDGLSPDDIVQYLLADGITVDHLNYVNYEKDF